MADKASADAATEGICGPITPSEPPEQVPADVRESLTSTEQALHENEVRFAAIFASAMDAVLTVDDSLRIVLYNEAAEKMFQCPIAEALGQKLDRFIPMRFRHEHEEHIRNFGKTGITRRRMGMLNQVYGLRANGEEFPIEASISQFEIGGRKSYTVILRDITERMRGEGALRESEARKGAILEASLDAIITIDHEGSVVEWNPAAEKTFGHSPSQVMGRKMVDIIVPERLREAHEKGLARYLATGEGSILDRRIEIPALRADGSEFPAEMAITRIPLPGPPTFTAFLRDITESKTAERALKQSQKDLKRAQAVAKTGSWRLDVRQNILLWSEESYRIFEIPKGTPMTYEAFLAAVHPSDRDLVDKSWKAALRGRPYNVEHRIIAGSKVKWVREQAELEFDSEGALLGGFGTVQDITQAKLAEAEIRSLARFPAESPAPIIRVNSDGAILYRNSPATDLLRTLGWQTGQLLPEPLLTPVRVSLTTGGTLDYELHCPPDRVFSFALVTIREEGYVNLYGHDITERKQAAEALLQNELQLRALNETLEERVSKRTAEVQRLADRLRALAAELTQAEQRERQRLARILHDHLQQLLVAARMQVEMIRRDPAGKTAEAAIRSVDSILKEAVGASRSLTVELSPPILQEGGLAAGLAWIAARMDEKNQFKVSVRADNQAEPASQDIRYLLFECVRELLFNSVKHSGVREAHVTMDRVQKNLVKIVVEDKGRGFDPASLRSDSAADGGFGLFSVQQRLAYCGGRMDLETAPGSGVRITLLAPCERASGRARLNASLGMDGADWEYAPNSGVPAPIRVVLVDDHKILREGLASLLALEPDIEVVGEAQEGAEAIALTERLQPDVLVMDINLPGMNGIEATWRIKAGRPSTHIIGLSMHKDNDIAAAMRDAGASAYLTKGGPSEELLATIRACHSSGKNKH